MASEINWPIVVAEGDDVMFFRAPGGLGYLEAIDVENDEYVAYDGTGRLLRLGVGEASRRSWIWGQVTHEMVIAEFAEESPVHVQALRDLLIRYLGHRISHAGDASDLTTAGLLERALACGDVLD